MAGRHGAIEGVVEFATAQRSRSIVFLAAISFAIFHGIAIATSVAASDLNSNLQWQIIHLGAVFCRFVLPFGLIVGALIGHIRAKRAARSNPLIS